MGKAAESAKSVQNFEDSPWQNMSVARFDTLAFHSSTIFDVAWAYEKWSFWANSGFTWKIVIFRSQPSAFFFSFARHEKKKSWSYLYVKKSDQTDSNSSRYGPPFLSQIHRNYKGIENLLCWNQSKSAFQPMEVCSKLTCLEVSRVNSECFYALLWRSRWVLSEFWLLLTFFDCFGPFLTLLGAL